MGNISSRHHYLPRFYIKNFCNKEGSIFRYNKLEGNYNNFLKRVPKNIFFEWDRNNYEVNGEISDIIEILYRKLEDKTAPYLEALVNPDNGFVQEISTETLRNLIYIGYMTKWRIPANDTLASEIHSKVSFNELNIFAKLNEYTVSLDDLVNDDIGRELKRMILATSIFSNQDIYNKVFKNSFIISFPHPLLATDNPFIELPLTNNDEVPSFIFPLSSNLLLVSCSFINKHDLVKTFNDERNYSNYINSLYACVQISLMKHAEQFVGCEDEKYLKSIVEKVEADAEKFAKIGVDPAFAAFYTLKNYSMFFQN
jgi:hypothetical protein